MKKLELSIKIVAVMDNKTSKICWYLNGRIILIGRLIEQKDKFLAKTFEEVKKIAPWYKSKEIDRKIKGVLTNKLAKEIGLPPYHGFCRTTAVISYVLEAENFLTE